MAERESVGVIGATSFVGQCVLSLLKQADFKVVAFSRQPVMQLNEGVEWHLAFSVCETTKNGGKAEAAELQGFEQRPIPYWICLAPIKVFPEYFPMLKDSCAKRVVVLSSTSRFTKDDSSDASERLLAQSLIDAEDRLQAWAEEQGIDWVVLRPTLIYGLGKDKNVSEIIRLIHRFGFFPLLGQAKGLRQPVHAQDVAMACVTGLSASEVANKSYNISGGETLTYKEMVGRVFAALGRKPFFIRVPVGLLRKLMQVLSYLPRYRNWTPAMVERMNKDMVFDHSDAMRDLGFKPRGFVLAAEDLPN
ncbi:MAG: NAD-dependent epimerase/dehydratase family protein [Methylomonas sp.]